MRPRASTSPLETASTFLVGGGILTMALFPLALPMIALLAVAAIPLLLIAVAAGIAAAALAAPVLLLRGLWRRFAPMRSRGRTDRPAPRAREGVNVASSGVAGR
jgi:hypothetical protein